MGLATNPHYACEVTLQPVDRYPLDAAILFSDILTIPDAMGLGLSFVAGEGPKFEKPVQDEAAVKALYVPDPADKLKYVTDAVCEIKRALNNRIPLIGFSGSPFTLACYMVEGGSSANYRKVKEMMYRRPDLFNAILEKKTNMSRLAARRSTVSSMETNLSAVLSAVLETYRQLGKAGKAWSEDPHHCFHKRLCSLD